jgi:hypothetical protein
MTQWSADEMTLWNAMHDPGHGRKRVTLHSVNPKDRKKYKELVKTIEDQKIKDFSDGWKYYNRWIEH